MMAEDFANGFVLIDPTGKLAEATADRAPVQNTFYLDPSDIGHPPGFNVFASVPEDDRHKVAQDIRDFIDALYPQGANTLTRARSSYLLLNSLRLLLDNPGSTFLSVSRLLTDIPYRTKYLGHSTDQLILEFWNVEFASWDKKDRQAAALDVQTKLGELLSSPIIRNIVGQRHSTFTLDRENIVIANLDRAKLGDQTAFLLGSLLISRSKGTVYINDLGFFASDRLAALLQQDRFTVACQYLQELHVKLQQAALSIENKTVFKTTREDAERLAFYVGVANPGSLIDLDPQQARILSGVIEPAAPPSGKRLRPVQRRSRACFTRPRRKVEKEIKRSFLA